MRETLMTAQLTVEQRQSVRRLSARGLSLREIGRQVGCSHEVVRAVVRRDSKRPRHLSVGVVGDLAGRSGGPWRRDHDCPTAAGQRASPASTRGVVWCGVVWCGRLPGSAATGATAEPETRAYRRCNGSQFDLMGGGRSLPGRHDAPIAWFPTTQQRGYMR
ncbi:helix-turn-helix domain-containing protein [Micromonospora chersina]|uniref:helix-turn-helix domain-containing protein n=1 Tax=Micromonospora chersina TaxID=47854 RepID=UPI0034516673